MIRQRRSVGVRTRSSRSDNQMLFSAEEADFLLNQSEQKLPFDDDDGDDSTSEELEEEKTTKILSAHSYSSYFFGIDIFLLSLLIILLSPLLLLDGILRGFGTATRRKWFLGSSSRCQMIAEAISNVVSLGILLYVVAVVRVICSTGYYLFPMELFFKTAKNPQAWAQPLVISIWSTIISIKTHVEDHYYNDNLTQLIHFVSLDSIFVTGILLFLMCMYYRKKTKGLLLLIMLCFSLGGLIGLYTSQHNAIPFFKQKKSHTDPIISALDPDYVMIQEPIWIAIDGQNLEQGASVGWVPYWTCLHSTPIEKCALVAVSEFHSGGVFTTFPSIDEYIPCFQSRNSTLPRKCYTSVRLRVRNEKNQPGWSLKKKHEAGNN